MPGYVAKLTHPQRRDRRRQIADRMRAGATVTQVSREFGVSRSVVVHASRENKVQAVRPGRKKGLLTSTLQRFSGVDWKQRDSEIAVKIGVSRERVRQVRAAMFGGSSNERKRRTVPRPEAGPDAGAGGAGPAIPTERPGDGALQSLPGGGGQGEAGGDRSVDELRV